VWLTERAQVVEEMTGQLHTAVRLLRLAQEFHPEDTLTRQLSTVASLQDGLQGWHPHQTLHACCASLLHCQAVSVSHGPASVLHFFCVLGLCLSRETTASEPVSYYMVHAMLYMLLCMLHVYDSRTE